MLISKQPNAASDRTALANKTGRGFWNAAFVTERLKTGQR